MADIKVGKWMKDREDSAMDRWLLPLSEITAGVKCLDFQYDAHGTKRFGIIERSFKWLKRHTYPVSSESVYKEGEIDETFVMAYIFEEL